MNIAKNKVTIPPPKFHDFTKYGANAKANISSNVIWEIGVPGKHSLPWSIVLSYLYTLSDSNLIERFKKIIGDEKEVEEIKEKKKMGSKPPSAQAVKRQLKNFNPFKNRNVFYHQAKEVTEIFRIFDLRLKRYGNSLKQKNDEWNDDFKLNAASLLLECEIEVHLGETGNQKITSYPKSPHEFTSKIVLFQHEDQQHGSRRENINIFRFGMSVQEANPLKVDALNYFLRKTKISSKSISKVKELCKNSGNHGKCFLTAILKNEYDDIVQSIYRSPYIALKISEAGFETDPLSCSTEELSVFGQSVLFSNDSKNLSILYDYASNCRRLFDHSVRKASDTMLDALKQIKSLLEEDISKLSTNKKSKDSDSVERSLGLLKQFIAYAKCQIEVVSALNNLGKNFDSTRTNANTFKFRKEVIESILKHYEKYFYFNLDREPSISDKLSNYLQFSEYYRNVDSFGCISFFDNFYQLRLLIDLKQENIFLNIEWKMFVAILLNNYFPKYDHETGDNLMFDENNFENVNVLRYIPLLYRNVLQNEIPSFLKILKDAPDLQTLKKSLKIYSPADDSNALPMIMDALLKIRLEIHLQAALDVSPDDGIKFILAIERALQVIGESIKPPSSSNSIISFYLRSCLSSDLQKCLILIRNDLSHQRCNSAYGQVKTEEDVHFFQQLQKEIAHIKTHFKTVFFTQFLRIEESAMISCFNEIGRELRQDVREVFKHQYSLRVNERQKIYETNHGKCVELLFDTLCDLQNHITENAKKEVLMAQFKAIDFLVTFISKHTSSDKVLNNLKAAVHFQISDLENKEKEIFKNELRLFLSKWIEVLQKNKITGQGPLSVRNIESFPILLKSDLFSLDEESQIKAAIFCAYEEAVDAKEELKKLFKLNSNETENFEISLNKIFIPPGKKTFLRSRFISQTQDKKLKNLLEQKHFPKEQYDKDIEELFTPKDGLSTYFIMLLTKITYQKYLNSPIYTSVKLSDHILEKLEFFLTKSLYILIEKIKSLKSILIDEDDEIHATWVWGKSKEIKHHVRFLMRQRYMRDITVRVSLDMAFFNCINILHKPILSDLYEKSVNLFSGIDLRNVLSHRTNIPESIGGILDEDDFPSTMVEKMLELIDDLEALESTLELFPKFGALEKEEFEKRITVSPDKKYMKQIKAITECKRWNDYSFLFPFIKT